MNKPNYFTCMSIHHQKTTASKGRYAREKMEQIGQQIEHILSYKKVQMAVQSAHLCRSNSYPLYPLDPSKKGGCICEERTLRRSQTGQTSLGLSCKANKCSDTGAGDLGVLPAQETNITNENNFQNILGISQTRKISRGHRSEVKFDIE